jgi:hypothetical protein
MLEINPYAPPASRIEIAPPLEAEAVRRLHLQREACAKGLSFVFFGIGVALLIAATLLSLSRLSDTPAFSPSDIGHLMAALMLAALSFRIAFGLRRLDREMRLWLTPLAALLLPLVPFGTVVASWMYYQLLSRKASAIFQNDYRSVISQTPNMRTRVSLANLAILALLLLSAGAGIFMYTMRLV